MLIEFTRPVTFYDATGAVVHQCPIGERIVAAVKIGCYYVTPMGSVFYDEAKIVEDPPCLG
jgi:hypothetical protein